MRTSTFIKVATISMGFASFAFGSPIDRPLFGTQATCNCKNSADCTCPRGQCKCKGCGHNAKSAKPAMLESLQGSTEKTRLPETARHDARGGVFI